MTYGKIGNETLVVTRTQTHKQLPKTSSISTDTQTIRNLHYIASKRRLPLTELIRDFANTEIGKLPSRERVDNELRFVDVRGVIVKK